MSEKSYLKETKVENKPTWSLYLCEEDYQKIIKQQEHFPTISKYFNVGSFKYDIYKWHIFIYTNKFGNFYRTFGSCGDFTFGSAPGFTNLRFLGNKRAALNCFTQFIDKFQLDVELIKREK